MKAIQACDRTIIELDAAVVMPDHAHAIFRLIDTCTLGQVLKRIKGRSARQINQVLKTEGAVWMDESFDHIIRHETELQEKTNTSGKTRSSAALHPGPRIIGGCS